MCGHRMLKTGGSGNTAAASAAAEGRHCRRSRPSGHLLQAVFAVVAFAAACAASTSAALAALATLARSACVTAPATTARRAALPRPKRGAAAAAAARRAWGARRRAFHHSSQRRSCAAEQRFCGSIRPRREAGPVHIVLQALPLRCTANSGRPRLLAAAGTQCRLPWRESAAGRALGWTWLRRGRVLKTATEHRQRARNMQSRKANYVPPCPPSLFAGGMHGARRRRWGADWLLSQASCGSLSRRPG